MVLKVEVPPDLVCGDVDEGFGAVADAFRRNLATGQEIGAACTLVPVFSATKGMAAATMAVAHARGWFELDAPVADHWPAFADNGKQHLTVRQLPAHQAGLGVLSRRVDLALAADHDRLGPRVVREPTALADQDAWNRREMLRPAELIGSVGLRR